MKRASELVKTASTVCGGWFSLMSGALTVPFTVFALIFRGTDGVVYAVMAYVSLWVFGIGAARKNYLSQKRLLKVEGITRSIEPSGNDLCFIKITNPTQDKTIKDITVRLVSMDKAPEKLSLPFQLLRENWHRDDPNLIHPGDSVDFILFQATLCDLPSSGGENFVFAMFIGSESSIGSEPEQTLLFCSKDHVVKIQVIATDCPMVEKEFYLNFKFEDLKCSFRLRPKS